jgi:antitoxin (DNA-binding transcriptional repressor) of toxin-antitoxin stability system
MITPAPATGDHAMTVTIVEAQARLSELIDQLGHAGSITITRGDRAVAQIVPPPVEKPHPVPGPGRGKLVIVSEDKEHLKDFEEYMP